MSEYEYEHLVSIGQLNNNNYYDNNKNKNHKVIKRNKNNIIEFEYMLNTEIERIYENDNNIVW